MADQAPDSPYQLKIYTDDEDLPEADENNFFMNFYALNGFPCLPSNNAKYFDSVSVEGWITLEEYTDLVEEINAKTRAYSIVYHILHLLVFGSFISTAVGIYCFNYKVFEGAHYWSLIALLTLPLSIGLLRAVKNYYLTPSVVKIINEHLARVNEEKFHNKGVHIVQGAHWLLINIDYHKNNYKPPKSLSKTSSRKHSVKMV